MTALTYFRQPPFCHSLSRTLYTDKHTTQKVHSLWLSLSHTHSHTHTDNRPIDIEREHGALLQMICLTF